MQTFAPYDSRAGKALVTATLVGSLFVLFATVAWISAGFDESVRAGGCEFVETSSAVYLGLAQAASRFDPPAGLCVTCGIFLIFCGLTSAMFGLNQ
jgi:hypothetical protein